MRRRILLAILSITGLVVLLFGVPLLLVVSRFAGEDATLRIERQAVLAARQVPGDFRTSNDPVELPASTDGVALALYARDGTLVAGNGPPAADAAVLDALHNRIATRTQSGDRIVAVPVTADESVVGVIRGAQPTSQTDARTIRIAALLGAIACGVVGVGAVIGFVVAGRLARPVRRLRDAAVQLGDGDFTVEIPRSKVPELDEAADALVVTSQRLHDLVARERSFTADASHQLRTPLAGLRAAIETELSFPRPDPSELLHEALDDIARLERTIGELLTIARAPDSRPSTCLLVDVERALALSWHGRYAAVGRRLTFANADDVPPVRGSGAVLRHVLDVLLDNALVHGAGHTRVDHAIGTESVTLTVGDEGEGWAPAPRLDGAEEGATPRAERPHGLGLPLARRLIETMPGRLVIARSGRHPRIDLVVGLAEPSVARPRDAADVRPVVV